MIPAHINVYTHIHTYIRIYIYAYTYTCIRIYILTYAYIHAYTKIYIHIHTYTYLLIYLYMHKYTNIYIAMYTATKPIFNKSSGRRDYRARCGRKSPKLICLSCYRTQLTNKSLLSCLLSRLNFLSLLHRASFSTEWIGSCYHILRK